jgi:hypothetical protein
LTTSPERIAHERAGKAARELFALDGQLTAESLACPCELGERGSARA